MTIELQVVTKTGHANYGEVVYVQEAGSRWGPWDDIRQWVKEGNDPKDFNNTFTILKVDGMTVEEAKQKYLQQWTEQTILANGAIDDVLIQPKLYHVEIERATTEGASTDPDGAERVSKAILGSLARNQKTGVLEKDE